MRMDQRDDESEHENDVDGSSLDGLGSIFHEIIDQWNEDFDKSERLLEDRHVAHSIDASCFLDNSDDSVFYNADMACLHLDQIAEDRTVQDTPMMILQPSQLLSPEDIVLDPAAMVIDHTHHDNLNVICLETLHLEPQDILVWHGGIIDYPFIYNTHGGNKRLREIAGREPFASQYGLATNEAIKQVVLAEIQIQVHMTGDGYSLNSPPKFLVLLECGSRYRLATQDEIYEEIRRSIRFHFNIRPCEKDVIFGRGFRCREFEGNVRYRAFIDDRRSEYRAAGRDRRKRLVEATRKYVEEVVGGRFLLPFDQARPLEDGCIIAPKDSINRKVAHRYREKRRRSIMNRYLHIIVAVMCRTMDKSVHTSTTGSGYTFSSPDFSNALTFSGHPTDLYCLPNGTSSTANFRLCDNSRVFLGIVALDISMESMEHLFELAPAELSSFQREQTGSDRVLANLQRTHPLGALEELHRNMLHGAISLAGSFEQLYEQYFEDIVPQSCTSNNNNGSATCMFTNPVGKTLSVESRLSTHCPTMEVINNCRMLNFGASESPPFAAFIGDNDQFAQLNPDARFDGLRRGKVDVLESATTIAFERSVRKRNPHNFIIVAQSSSLVECAEKRYTTFGTCASLKFCVTNSTTQALVSQEFQGRPIHFSDGSADISIARSQSWFQEKGFVVGTKPLSRESLALVTRDDDPLWSKYVTSSWVVAATVYAKSATSPETPR